MTHYDFHALLEPYEYQELVCDVLQVREKVQLEVYKEGRDQGIDGSFRSLDGRTIVQAKRCKMNFVSFLRMMEREELPKVKRLNPDRYILAVSMDFTPLQKQRLLDVFDGYILETRDIITQGDINLLFESAEYEGTQMAYPKLWYASFRVMKKVLRDTVDAGYCAEIQYELMEAVEQTEVYVPTKIFKHAIKNWNQRKTIMITGVPGIGKTSMARALALSYLTGYDLAGYVWVHSVQEVYNHWNDAERVVFILDDFWGSIFREDRTNQEEQRLVKLIKRIYEGKEERRLILTTREYILQQGYNSHPELKEKLERYAFICSMEEYSIGEKASILYRHLYASGLEYSYVKYLYEHSEEIVYHRNYDPRTLALFLSEEEPESSPSDYLSQLYERFDSPYTFWENIFRKLTKDAQIVAMMIMISSAGMFYEDLKQCYAKYVASTDRLDFPESLEGCIAELEKTIIITNYDSDVEQISLRFRLPAVQDFLYDKLYHNAQKYVQVLQDVCCFYNQIVFLYRHFGKKCNDYTKNMLAENLISEYQNGRISNFDSEWQDEFGSVCDEPSDINLTRFRQLLLLYRDCPNFKLRRFIEETAQAFCSMLGQGDFEEVYYDLWNLPDALRIMKEMGLHIPSEDIVCAFCDNSCSIHHYDAMSVFKDLYPDKYKAICEPLLKRTSEDIDGRVIREIYELADWGMDYSIGILLDLTKEIYEKMGWKYTDELERDMYIAAGPGYRKVNGKFESDKIGYDTRQYHDRTFDQIYDENIWVLGPVEKDLCESEICATVLTSDVPEMLKNSIIYQIKHRKGFLQYYFDTEKDCVFYLTMLMKRKEESILKNERDFLLSAILSACEDDQVLSVNLLKVLSVCYCMFLHCEEPVVRKKTLYEDEDIRKCFEKDMRVKQVFEKHFIVDDGVWIRFCHIPVFILAFVLYTVYENMFVDEPLQYDDIFIGNDPIIHLYNTNSRKSRREDLYTDCGCYPFPRGDWLACMYRLYELCDPWEFNKQVLHPAINKALNRIESNNAIEEVFAYVKYMDLIVFYDAEETLVSYLYESDDDIDLLFSLDMLEECVIEPIPADVFATLKCSRCEAAIRREKHQSFSLAKLRDYDVLKRIVDVNKIEAMIKGLKEIRNRFERGEYLLE